MSNFMKSEFTNIEISHYPVNYQLSIKLKNGKNIFIRPVKPCDEKKVRELHFSLDNNDWFYRFFSYEKKLGINEIKSLVNINYNIEMVLVAEFIKEQENEIVAIGGFFRKMDPCIGELIFITHKKWRNLGITKALLNHLIKIARDLNYTKLGGVINIENKPIGYILDSIENRLHLKKISNKIAVVLIDLTK
ncbi:MAG: GNAT family N-acetyltransferase [Promethearchaeota archaeon]